MQEDVRLYFIAAEMRKYFENVIKDMQAAILQTQSVDSRTLLQSLSYNVYQQYADGNGNLSFAEWGRFLDMGVSRGHPLGGIQATKKALQKGNSNKIKPRKIYSPIVYGQLNGLIARLSSGFTQATIDTIKNNLINHV